ncbi:MAG: DUF6086 family protein [Nibricoccus sp.]
MSYIFENIKESDRTIWWPSNVVALAFLGDVHLLEKETGLMSGMKESASNMITIDPEPLQKFAVAAFNFWSESNNQSLKVLLQGAMLHLIALCIACGKESCFERLKIGDLLNDARTLVHNVFEHG